MYVVRLSCELPYAVGVRKNRLTLLHGVRESKNADRICLSLRIAVGNPRYGDLGREELLSLTVLSDTGARSRASDLSGAVCPLP